MRRVFVCFLEEIEDSKKVFRNYLTFRWIVNHACHRLNQAGRSVCINLNENKMPKTFLDFYTRLKTKELIWSQHVNLTTSPDLKVISFYSL